MGFVADGEGSTMVVVASSYGSWFDRDLREKMAMGMDLISGFSGFDYRSTKFVF